MTINNFVWPIQNIQKNPFCTGEKFRPLSISIDLNNLSGLGAEEKIAIQTIDDFLDQGIINLIKIEGSSDPLKINSFDGKIYYEDEFKGMSAIQIHTYLGRDIFITKDLDLFNDNLDFSDQNIFLPVEAIRFIGLLARSKNIFELKYMENGKIQYDRQYFYILHANKKLPSNLQLLQFLSKINQEKSDIIRDLGLSIKQKSSFALQSIDEIGQQTFLPQDFNTQQTLLYHFNYFTILLSGAFDSILHIINIQYDIEKNERNLTSRKNEFIKKIKEFNPELFNLIDTTYLTKTLSILRNTIHSVSLSTHGIYEVFPQQTHSFLEIPKNNSDDFLSYVDLMGNRLDWGVSIEKYNLLEKDNTTIKHEYRVLINPYFFARCLLDKWFNFLEDIAITITSTFSSFSENTELNQIDPSIKPIDKWLRERLEILL